MPNFCPHCGTAVSAVNSELCVNCGKPLNAIPESPKNELFNDSKDKLFNLAKNVKDFSVKASEDLRSDETKAKIKDLANQAQSFASEKTKDLKEELEKINEARKATANEAKDFESTSKLENSKAVASSFWSKLSSKQKLIFIGLPVFLFVCLMALFEDKKPENWSWPYASQFISTCTQSASNVGDMRVRAACACTMLGVKKKYSMNEHTALVGKASSYEAMVAPILKNCQSNWEYYKNEPAPY